MTSKKRNPAALTVRLLILASEGPFEQVRNESADAYARVVVRLNDRWRIIECRSGMQWILQRAEKRHRTTEWRGCSYCRTREALIRCIGASTGEIDPHAKAILDDLPNWIGGRP